MKITDIRTRVAQWNGKTAELPPNFCTNPMDLMANGDGTMGKFTFHGWLIVEVFTDQGIVGIGESALAPLVTKQFIDLYLKPILVGQNPWDIEFLWQCMYRNTIAFGRKGVGMVAISAVDIALWDVLGKATNQPVYRLLGGKTKSRIPVYASRLYSTPLDELAQEAAKYRDQGYQAVKMRFGWGPRDGAAGMQKNLDLLRTLRDVLGDGVDIMADAYMGWTLDYAKRMLRFSSRSIFGGSRSRSSRTTSADTRLSRRTGGSPSRAANTSSRRTGSASCSRRRRSTTSSSIRTASEASARRGRSRHWRRPSPFRSFRTPDRCTTTTSSWRA